MRLDMRASIAEFSRWHQNAANRACHDIGIPTVAIAALGLLARLSFGPELPLVRQLDAGLLVLGAALVFDLVHEWRLAPFVAVLGLGCWAIGRELSLPMLGVVFVVGWIFQLGGYRVAERNAPAFATNLVHLLVGPRWLVNRWFRILPEPSP